MFLIVVFLIKKPAVCDGTIPCTCISSRKIERLFCRKNTCLMSAQLRRLSQPAPIQRCWDTSCNATCEADAVSWNDALHSLTTKKLVWSEYAFLTFFAKSHHHHRAFNRILQHVLPKRWRMWRRYLTKVWLPFVPRQFMSPDKSFIDISVILVSSGGDRYQMVVYMTLQGRLSRLKTDVDVILMYIGQDSFFVIESIWNVWPQKSLWNKT